MNDSAGTRIERLENNEKKKKLIITAVIVVLIAIFLGGMVWGINDVLLTEGTYPEPEAQSVHAFPETGDDVVGLFYRHFYDARLDCKKTKFSVSNSFDIPQDSITCEEGGEELAAVLKYVKGSFADALTESSYENYDGSFGTDAADKLIKPLFSAAEATLSACYIGESEDDGTPLLDDDGNQKNTQNYYFKFRFAESPLPASEHNILYGNFNLAPVQDIIDGVIADNAEYFTVDSYNVMCRGFAIDADSNRFTGNLNYICYTRSYDITADITFTGECAAYGAHTVNFTAVAKQEYFFSWAGIELDCESITLDKGDSQQLKAYRTADEDLTVTWTSSNPEIATVDQEGYVKGKAHSAQPVTVTATVEYLGNTYTDSCEVYIVEPVERILVSPRELSLKVGSTAQLTAEITPHKATIKDVMFISLDESIATVDEKGVITAVAPGEAQVIAVSVSGRYKSTCTVSVTE